MDPYSALNVYKWNKQQATGRGKKGFVAISQGIKQLGMLLNLNFPFKLSQGDKTLYSSPYSDYIRSEHT